MNACRTSSLASEGSLHREGPPMQYLHCDLQQALHGSCTGRRSTDARTDFRQQPSPRSLRSSHPLFPPA